MRMWLASVVLIAVLGKETVSQAKSKAVSLEMHITEASKPGKKQEVRTTVLDEKVRLDFSKQGTLIYDLKTKTQIVLDHKKKTYFELDEKSRKVLKERLSQVASTMAAMKPQMEGLLKQLPEKQRKQMEEFMNAQSGGKKKKKLPTFEVKTTGKKSSVVGVACNEVQVLKDKKIAGNGCVAKYQSHPVLGKIQKSYTQMTKDMLEIMDGLPNIGAAGNISELVTATSKLQEKHGFPLKWMELKDGKPGSTMIVQAIKEIGGDPASYQIPKGYKQQSIPTGL